VVAQLLDQHTFQREDGPSPAVLRDRGRCPVGQCHARAALERRGLLACTAHPSHGRILRAELTPEGRRLLRKVNPVVARLQDELVKEVPDGEREIVVRSLASVMRA
jgi:hypothetical protein